MTTPRPRSNQVVVPAPIVRSNSTKFNKMKLKKRISTKTLSASFSPFQLKTREIDAKESRKRNTKNTFYFTTTSANTYTDENPRAAHTTIHTVAILGASGSGKSDLIQKIMNLEGISVPAHCTPENTGANIGKIVRKDGEDVLFTLKEIANVTELENLVDCPCLSFIVLYDHTQPKTKKKTKEMIKTVSEFRKKNTQHSAASLLLILSKIDRFAASARMEKIFSFVVKLSREYKCKLLPVTVTMNKTNLLAALRVSVLPETNDKHLTVNSFQISLSQSSKSYIFADDVSSVIEDFLWVQKNTGQWNEAYCVVKGEFLIQQIETEITVLFLTVCTTKLVTTPGDAIFSDSAAFKISTPGGNQYLFSINSEDRIHQWIDRCDVSLDCSDVFTSRSHRSSMNTSPDLEFSAILNIANNIGCVDCRGRCGSPIISRQFCIYLCSECASAHTLVLGKGLSKILSPQEVKNFSTIWPALHSYCNDQFNLFWEYSKPVDTEITNESTPEDRIAYIRAKYKTRDFYGCYRDPLYCAVSPTSLEWKRTYLLVSHNGQLTISDDEEGSLNETTTHISYCTFTPGSDLGLSSNYFRVIGPDTQVVFRTELEETVREWLSVLYSTAQRVKHTQLSYMNPLMSLPRIRKRRSEGLRYSMAELNALLHQKQELTNILKLRSKQESIKETLEQNLNATLKQIQSLKDSEKRILTKIASLEPAHVRSDMISLTSLMTEASRRDLMIKPGDSFVQLTGRGNSAPKVSAKRKNKLDAVEGGILILSGNIVKGGTVNKIVEALVSPLYDDSEYTALILNTYPSFIDPIAFLDSLEQNFVLPIRDAASSVNFQLEKIGNKPNKEKCTVTKGKRCNYIQSTRCNILNFLGTWMEDFWYSDFQNSQMLIAKLITFLDYIVSSIPTHQVRANELRNKFIERFQDSLRNQTIQSFVDEGTIGKLSALPRGGISSLADCIEVLTDVDISDVAKQLCLIDHGLISNIQARELIDKAWTTVDREELSPNVVKVTDRFNKLAAWVGTCILQSEKKRQRIKILEWFILLAQKCIELHNYHALIAILGGIQDPSIARMKKTWDGVSPRIKSIFDEIVSIMQLKDNWANYRRAVENNISEDKPCVPYLGIYLKDLMFIDDAFPDYLDVSQDLSVVNIEKRRKASVIMNELNLVKKTLFSFQRVGVVISSLELGLSMFPLLDESQRFAQSKKLEPRNRSPRK